ncbi:hypothetical protein D3C87_1646240 [compost metagenome]
MTGGATAITVSAGGGAVTTVLVGTALVFGTPTENEILNGPMPISSPLDSASSKTAWPFLKVPAWEPRSQT